MGFVVEAEFAPASLGRAVNDARSPIRLPGWMGRICALLLSILIQAGMIAMLLIMTGVVQPSKQQSGPRMILLDLVSPAQSEAGAVDRVADINNTPIAPPTDLQVADHTDLPHEWSLAKLPPLSPAKPTPQAAQSPASGEANTGSSTGAGVDPYAFASYRPELVVQMAPTRTLLPDAAALAALEQAIRAHLPASTTNLKLQMLVDQEGRIGQAELLSPVAAPARAIVLQAVRGAVLFSPDPARPQQVRTTLTLTI